MAHSISGEQRVSSFMMLGGLTGLVLGIGVFAGLAHWRVFGSFSEMSVERIFLAISNLSAKAILIYGGIG